MRRRRSAEWAAVGAGLVLLGTGGLAAGVALGASKNVTVRAGDSPVNEGAGDPADVDAHNSPVVVRDPTDGSNVVVANRVDLQDFSCAVHVSHDGGESWKSPSLPVPEGEGDHCYAPDVAFGPQGTLYVAYVTLSGRGNTPHAVWLMSSDDGAALSPSRPDSATTCDSRCAWPPTRTGRDGCM